jgi:hypothetical protein
MRSRTIDTGNHKTVCGFLGGLASSSGVYNGIPWSAVRNSVGNYTLRMNGRYRMMGGVVVSQSGGAYIAQVLGSPTFDAFTINTYNTAGVLTDVNTQFSVAVSETI